MSEVVTPTAFPHGLRCGRCMEPIPPGAEYHSRPTHMDTLGPLADTFGGDRAEGLAWCELVCGDCIDGGTHD